MMVFDINENRRISSSSFDSHWLKNKFEVNISSSYFKPEANMGLQLEKNMLYWIVENLKGEWAYPYEHMFWFEKKEDALAFKLRWI